MRQLQHLLVYIHPYDSQEVFLQTVQPRACAGLTASSQLTYLHIHGGKAQLLPATALQHMFPAGKRLPRLQHLVFDSHDSQRAGCITTAELSSLVDACPALTSLDLTRVLAADADVSALLKLPQQCQHLGVGGQAFGDKAAGVVAQLTQLKQLQWVRSGLTDAGLARLTALHALDKLFMEDNDLSPHLAPQRHLSLETKAGGKVRRKELSCSWLCCWHGY
jgi:hypothetical protein